MARQEAVNELHTRSSQSFDLSLAYNHLFNDRAKKALSITVSEPETVVRKTNLGPNYEAIDTVKYFSRSVFGQENIIKGARYICDAINLYSKAGFITGCRMPLQVLKMPSEAHELEKYVLLLGVSVTEQGVKVIDENKKADIFDDDNETFPAKHVAIWK